MLEICDKFDIRLQVVHTPGAALDRPDRLSRGFSPEAPRVRMKLSTFAKFEIKFGPFTEFVGAERSLATRLAEPSTQGCYPHFLTAKIWNNG